MTTVLPACDLCGSSVARKYATIRSQAMVACGSCGLHYVHPRLRDDAGELYSSLYAEWGQGWWQWSEGSAAQHRWILGQLRRRVPLGLVYDVGCGGGFFLDLCRQAGYEVAGCEPSEHGAAHARELLGIEVRHASIEDVPLEPESLDVVSLNNVLEHLASPSNTLGRLRTALRPGGLITVSVPNLLFAKLALALSTPLEWLRLPNPAHALFHLPAHLYFFTPRTISLLLARAGFERIEIYNEVPVRNPGRLKNVAKSAQYNVARALRAGTGGRLVVGHALTCFARKPPVPG